MSLYIKSWLMFSKGKRLIQQSVCRLYLLTNVQILQQKLNITPLWPPASYCVMHSVSWHLSIRTTFNLSYGSSSIARPHVLSVSLGCPRPSLWFTTVLHGPLFIDTHTGHRRLRTSHKSCSVWKCSDSVSKQSQFGARQTHANRYACSFSCF